MNPIEFSLLAEPFNPADVEWRAQSTGFTKKNEPWAFMIPYITARAVQNRLDVVCGPSRWKNEYQRQGEGFLCGISILTDTGWVTKWDGAEDTEIESFKGGLSSSLKRAAIQWGIGRYLYQYEGDWATFDEKVTRDTQGALAVKIKKSKDDKFGETFYCLPPKMPKWAVPEEIKKEAKEAKKEQQEQRAAAAMVPDRKHLQSEVVDLCKRRGIKPGELATICAAQFDVAKTQDLTDDQLIELHDFIENMKGA